MHNTVTNSATLVQELVRGVFDQIMQSAFDTTALVLILVKARKHSNSGLITLIAKQGLVYYMYVCSQALQEQG